MEVQKLYILKWAEAAKAVFVKLTLSYVPVHCIAYFHFHIVHGYLRYYELGFCCSLVKFGLIHRVVHDRKNAPFPRPHLIVP